VTATEENISQQLRDPGDPGEATSMITAHQISGISDELYQAEERMKAMRGTSGDLRHHHNLHLAAHLGIALEQANQLKQNMLEHYPAEADEWRTLSRVMHLANDLVMATGYKLNPRSGMISLDLPSGTIDPVPGGVDDHHITVVYLGPDVDDDAFAEACDRAQKAAAAVPGPLKGSVGGVGSFPAGSDGVPAWAGVDLPGVDQIRKGLADLSASEHKDWKSHVTLAYVKPGEPLPDPVPQTPVMITHLSVHRGKDVVRFPLGGGKVDMCISDSRTMDLAKSVSPASKAASFAHLLQTVMYDGAHAQRHAEAMLGDTDDACWQFDADHAEKHLEGACEHAHKLAEHILDNYPVEAKCLRGLMNHGQGMSTITGQANHGR
jgi:2'-5' RNA ligase